MATASIHDHYIFGDESSHTGHRYLVVGTMDCSGEHLDEITTRLNAAKKDHAEYKWSRRPSRDAEHFVREIFHFIRWRKLRFRCIVVNTRHADHNKYSDGDRALSLEKYIFHHLLSFARPEAELKKLLRFHVQLDNRAKYKSAGQKAPLNRRFGKETGHKWEIFADVEDVDSQSQVMVQAADVITGCVAWVWNRQYDNERVDRRRIAFAEHIATQAGLRVSPDAEKEGIEPRDYRNFGYPTLPHQEKGFTIWKLNFRRKEEGQAKAEAKSILARYGGEATLGKVGQDYQIGAICFECERSTPDILARNAHRKLSERYRPKCGVCHRRGYLQFRQHRQPAS